MENLQLEKRLQAYTQWKQTLATTVGQYRAWLHKYKLSTEQSEQRINSCLHSLDGARVSLPRERFWDIPVPKIDSPTRQPLLPR
ncbi:MAG: hypothetical protein AB2815_04575, partial [Candidatus Sedimenticola endophacoides]